jgi:hypothetical protein
VIAWYQIVFYPGEPDLVGSGRHALTLSRLRGKRAAPIRANFTLRGQILTFPTADDLVRAVELVIPACHYLREQNNPVTVRAVLCEASWRVYPQDARTLHF